MEGKLWWLSQLGKVGKEDGGVVLSFRSLLSGILESVRIKFQEELELSRGGPRPSQAQISPILVQKA
jgi:hypothetical protein